MAAETEEEMELLRVSHLSSDSGFEMPGQGWGGHDTGKEDIFAEVPKMSHWSVKDQVLQFCGIGDDEEEEAEQWDKWKSRKNMMSKRMGTGHYRQPQPLGMDDAPYEGDEVDGQGRKKCRLYCRDKIRTVRPSRRVARTRSPCPRDVEPLWKMFVRKCKGLFYAPKRSEKHSFELRNRSFAPADLRQYGDTVSLMQSTDEPAAFQDSARWTTPQAKADRHGQLYDKFFDYNAEYTGGADLKQREAEQIPGFFEQGSGDRVVPEGMAIAQVPAGYSYDETDDASHHWRQGRSGGWEWREYPQQPRPRYESESPYQDMSRFSQQMKENFVSLIDNSDRWDATKSTCLSLITDGVFAKICGFQYDRYYKYAYDRETGTVRADRSSDHRSGFTAWMTFVQILICIVSVSVYGFAPFGIAQTVVSMEILQPSLALEKLSYLEPSNFWGGPRQAALIHLGAKFSPCMRSDTNVNNALALDRREENKTACCIFNDGSGCLQSSRGKCPAYLATFQKWSDGAAGSDDRVSGSVCGQDPKYCKNPASLGAYEWPDDITEWPICRDDVKATALPENRHLNCEIRGRPCCFGIQGECAITTRQHCDFLRGHFHEEATLCSQVHCMDEICGMLPFGNPVKPDQFYRLYTSLFLHAGLIQLVVTIIYNLFVLRPAEVMIGWIRTVLIFFGSGIAGSLASAIFLPYLVTAGPTGAHLGIIACHVVLIILFVEDRKWPLIKMFCFIIALIIFGLLPMVDNYANIFGFIFGFLLSFAVLPFARFSAAMSARSARMRRYIAIGVCSALAVGVAILLFMLFYVAPIYHCSWCHYFTCIPFTADFCLNQEVKMRGVVEL